MEQARPSPARPVGHRFERPPSREPRGRQALVSAASRPPRRGPKRGRGAVRGGGRRPEGPRLRPALPRSVERRPQRSVTPGEERRRGGRAESDSAAAGGSRGCLVRWNRPCLSRDHGRQGHGVCTEPAPPATSRWRVGESVGSIARACA